MLYLDRAPKSTVLEPGEARRITRARLARQLHKLPHEIDAAPMTDIHDLMEVWKMDDYLAEVHAKEARNKR